MKHIKVNYCAEDLKYKVFGLFPYFDKDVDGKLVLTAGESSVDGCFNKISCAIKLPVDFIVDDTVILEKDKTYNYQVLNNLYKQYKLLKNNDFIDFMNKGIGCVKVTADIDWDNCPLVPEEVNLAECFNLYNQMYKMKLICDEYEAKKASGEKINCELECLVSKYNDMGGDTMLNFYKSKSLLRESISTEYFEYADPSNTTYSINICFTNTYHDSGAFDDYTDIWQYTANYNKGDIVCNNGYSYICNDDNPTPIWDETNCTYVMDETKFNKISEIMDDVSITTMSDSKLKSFIGIKHYINENSMVETPDGNTDWLYFYKIGKIAQQTVTRDENNNIAIFDGSERNTDIDGTYETNLLAFGDVLTNITYSDDYSSITFEYIIGAHLKAKLVKIDITELNKPIYYYDKFVTDKDDKYHGVKYTETYSIPSDSEILDLINDGKFEQFVNSDILPGYEYVKGEFNLFDCINLSSTCINGTEYQYKYTPSSLESVANHDESTTYPLIKYDYYDCSSFTPKVENRVRFSRGNTAAFERHLKLGEVKSFDDFQNYANGGFFNLKQ